MARGQRDVLESAAGHNTMATAGPLAFLVAVPLSWILAKLLRRRRTDLSGAP